MTSASKRFVGEEKGLEMVEWAITDGLLVAAVAITSYTVPLEPK